MMVQWEQFLAGNHAPVHAERGPLAVEVPGGLPRELRGTFYRTGPNPQFAPLGTYHPFTGDGMVHAFGIRDGKLEYVNRWVRTGKFEIERRHGRSLYRGYAADPEQAALTGDVPFDAANTNMVWHAGSLLALYEISRPYELDPRTLETLGYWGDEQNFRGKMTAHPRIDPKTGEMLFFNYDTGRPELTFHVCDRNGRVVRSERIALPYSCMIHDFFVTEDYVVFPVSPAILDDSWRFRRDAHAYWDPRRGSSLCVLSRRGELSIQWIEIDNCMVFHPLNAFNTGSQITVDVVKYPSCPMMPDIDGNYTKGLEVLHKTALMRWTFDAVLGGGLRETEIDALPGEFPRIDDRFSGYRHRHGFMLNYNPKHGGTDTISHIDIGAGKICRYVAGEGITLSEPVFVPRTAQADEGDGFLITTRYDTARDESALEILDATDVERGPIAVAPLPFRFPFGFHAIWKPDGE